ncbi:acetoacetate decarboxylase family protein [Nonomuraea sp. NPDC050310]|uniref:acetoacetate decarboxylase family protein n=1 Tax=unclassified Nonomuraea TaxID=2593643 RepID=UPI0033E04B1E
MASHLIDGRTVTLPVQVRQAAVCTASYAVRADAARAVLAYTGVEVAEVLPGKAVCTLVFVDYGDSDLGAYHEFGMTFLVRAPGGGQPGAFVHWLPVDQRFTLAAGRGIWGFPKELAEVELRMSSPYKRCIVRKDGRLVLDLLIKPGLPVPARTPVTPLTAYTHLDGITRRIPATMRAGGSRIRPGGALIRLGNHPVAKELSELGLPKRALLTSYSARVAMSFEAAGRWSGEPA